MRINKKFFYITTSIAYTNSDPHLGFALELVQADVIARYQKLLGNKVFFLTGTDEHGAKVLKTSLQTGLSPQEFVDKISEKFRKLTKLLNLANTDFIRTTDRKRHWPVVKKVWLQLKKRRDIYKKKYKGIYCSGCEAFITKKDLVNGKCLIHQRQPEIVEEENYFFRLSRYKEQLKRTINLGVIKIIPGNRKREMINFIDQGLDDISFSRPRSSLTWGIEAPDDVSHTIYVWVDALSNYLSAVSYGKDKFKLYWPPDVQCIGKDIQKFHCIYWPAILLSLRIPLPKTIFIHGFITVGGQKMSKSLGNVVDPFKLIGEYGQDAVRYFLLREIPPTDDGDFTEEKFKKRYNSDLASGLGNLVSRIVALKAKVGIKRINPRFQLKNAQLERVVERNFKKYKNLLEEFKFNEALIVVWDLISFCDRYIEKEKPWEVNGKQKTTIESLLFLLKQIAYMLSPFMPSTSQKIIHQLEGGKIKALFPRV